LFLGDCKGDAMTELHKLARRLLKLTQATEITDGLGLYLAHITPDGIEDTRKAILHCISESPPDGVDIAEVGKLLSLNVPHNLAIENFRRAALTLLQTTRSKPYSSGKKINPDHEKAYQSYKIAEQTLGKCTDREAFEWLKNNKSPDYDLPPLDTWGRYLRSGRKFHDDNKNTPRAGRSVHAGSIKEDPNILKKISNKYTKAD
jgi:hypothetical protein